MLRQSRLIVAAVILGCQLIGPITGGGADVSAQTPPSGKTTPVTGDALLDRFLEFFQEAARKGTAGFEATYDAFSDMLDLAKQALADKRIDQRFLDRYERLLRVAVLSIIPDRAGLLLPVTKPETAAFVHDVTGTKVDGSSQDLGKMVAALTTEVQSLRKYQGSRPSAPGTTAGARETRPGPSALATSAAARETSLKKKIASAPADLQAYLDLAQLQEDSGATADAEATLLKARHALATNTDVLIQLAYFYNRRGGFEKTIEMLRAASRMDPQDAEISHIIATCYFDKVEHDTSVAPATRHAYIEAGIAAEDRALSIEPGYMEALVYKGVLLRKQAEGVTNPAEKTRLLAEAEALRARVTEARSRPPAVHRPRMSAATSPSAAARAFAPPPPPPPPPPSGNQAPVRVGGEIKPPVRIKNVPPEYPVEALASRTQGMVIVEATIGADGRVTNATVVRSVPLLDRAALAAVQQWLYEPTYVDGRPVPVIMTVTVNFTLQ
jgi:TonB family protein